MKTKYQLEDLGVVAQGDVWMNWRHARHPHNGTEWALGSLSRGGFGVIDPKTQTFIQVRPEHPFTCGWAVGQAPNGDIYQCDYCGPLYVWDWKGRQSKIACDHRFQSMFTLDVGPDGCVYLPDYTPNIMHRFNPATGRMENLGDFNALGQHIRNVFCARDGWVYVNCYSYDPTGGGGVANLAFNPRTGEKYDLKEGGGLTKDADGHVVISLNRWGRTF